jgi:hypothetical protein
LTIASAQVAKSFASTSPIRSRSSTSRCGWRSATCSVSCATQPTCSGSGSRSNDGA